MRVGIINKAPTYLGISTDRAITSSSMIKILLPTKVLPVAISGTDYIISVDH